MPNVDLFAHLLLIGRAVLKISDSQLSSALRNLYFQMVSRSAITLTARSMLHATESEFTPILKQCLDLNATADPTDVIITVIQGMYNLLTVYQTTKF